LSWLQSIRDDDDELSYLQRIAMLERELAHANEKIDDKIDKLKEYGVGITALTDKLAGAESRVDFLDGEVKRMERREHRRARQMQKSIACNKCGFTISLVEATGVIDQRYVFNRNDTKHILMLPSLMDQSQLLPSDIVTRDTMKKVLEQLESMKQSWMSEKRRLEGERDHLQRAANSANRNMYKAPRPLDGAQDSVIIPQFIPKLVRKLTYT
jgi:hypothetical protein